MAITAGWSRQDRHARSSGDSAAAGKAESGARSGMSTALGKRPYCKAHHDRTLEHLSLATEEACWELHQPGCETMPHQVIMTRSPQSLRGVPVTRPYLSPSSCAQLVRCASNSCTPMTEAFPPEAQQVHSPVQS